MVKAKQLLVKLLATTLACLFILSGIAFPAFAEEASTEGDLEDKLVAMNIAMNGQVSLLLYFKNIDRVEYYQVMIPQKNGAPKTERVYKDSLKYDSTKKRYELEISVPAAQQNDTISVQPFDAEGNPGKIRSYSIRDYANMLFAIAETNVEKYYYACEAVKAMLNYGAMAQIRFQYFENNLANQGLYLDGTNPASGMTLDDMPRIRENYATSASDVETSAECVLDGKVALKIYVDKLPSGTTIDNVKPWIGSGRGDDRGELVEDTFKFDASKGKYYAEVNNIPATLFDNLYDIEIRNQNGEALMKTTYSVFNYVEDALLAEHSDLAGSMYLYHVWASAYVNAVKNNITDIESGKDGIVKTDCEHTRTYTGLVVRPGKTCSDCGTFLRGFRELDADHESGKDIEAYWDDVDDVIYYNIGECTTSFTGFSVPVVISDLYKEKTVTPFNRFSLSYYSSEPVKVVMNYGDNKTAEYFLEAGENTFWGVLPGFMAKETANAINSLAVSACKADASTTFVLYNYTLENSDIPTNYSNGLVSIKGGDQKLTIDLFNGGAMTALSHDHLNGGVEDKYNLIKNVAATGLAQYAWQTHADTRLVDVQINDSNTSVYVKYHLGGTNTYFECTYFADAGNFIRVDNRQIDFSGIDGEFQTSALPEFYTVSYFPNLFTYDGSNSWTGDKSSYLTPSGTPSTYTYNFRSSSTETWCAWSPITDATQINVPAVGIYVPNVDSFEAKYTGPSTSMSPDTPEEYGRISMQKTIKTYSFEALEYSYFIASALLLDGEIDGKPAGVRNVFRNLYNSGVSKNLNEDLNNDCIPTRIPDENPDMTDINFAYEQMGLLLRDASDDNAVVRYHAKNASAIVEATGNNPYCYLDFTLYDFLTAIQPASTPIEYTADNYVQLRLTYMVPSNSNAMKCTIYLRDDNGTEKEIVTMELDKADVYSTEVIDLSGIENWTGSINKIKLVFNGATEGDVIYLRGIQLLTEEKRIAGADFIDELDAKDFLTVAPNDSMSYDSTEGAFKLIPGSVDPYFEANYTANGLSLEASKYHSVKLTYMIPEGAYYAKEGYHVDLYLDVKDSSGKTTTTKIRCSTIPADGKYHTIVIPLPQFVKTDTIVSARFDYLTYVDGDIYENDVFYLYSFVLSSKTQAEELASVDFTKKGSAGLMYSTGNLKETWKDEQGDYYFDYAYQLPAFVPSVASNQAGVEFDENMGALKLTATGTASDFVSNPEHFDPYVAFVFNGIGLSAEKYSGVRIKYKVAEDCSPNQRVQIFTQTSNMNNQYAGDASVIKYIDVDGEFHEIEVNLAELTSKNTAYWTGEIYVVRLDFFFVFYNGESNTMYITGIELIPAQ